MLKFFSLSFITGFCLGQSNDPSQQTNINALGGLGSNIVRLMGRQYTGMKGDPYLIKEFRPGKIVLENSSEYANLLINLDLITNELQVKKSQADVPFLVLKNQVKQFIINIDFDTILLVRKIDLLKKKNRFCWVSFQNEKASVLVDNVKQINKADNSGAYSLGRDYDEIVDEREYYFLAFNSKEPKSFTLKKKSIAELFPNERDKFNSFFNSNLIDLKDQEQLYRLFKFMLN